MAKKSKQSPPDLPDTVKENIHKIAEFYRKEEEKISHAQSVIEVIGVFFSSPVYFSGLIAFVVLWVAVNFYLEHTSGNPFDPPPFIWLQGIVALNGVLITIAVLIRQNRMAELAELRAHLNLHVNLLAEQKTTKVIQLLEELRRDSPNIKDREDPEVREMQKQTNPHAVLSAIEEHKIMRQLENENHKKLDGV